MIEANQLFLATIDDAFLWRMTMQLKPEIILHKIVGHNSLFRVVISSPNWGFGIEVYENMFRLILWKHHFCWFFKRDKDEENVTHESTKVQ